MELLRTMTSKIVNGGARRKYRTYGRRRRGGVLSQPGQLIPPASIPGFFQPGQLNIKNPAKPNAATTYTISASNIKPTFSRQTSSRISYPPRTIRNTSRSNRRSRRRRNRRSRRH